MDYRIAAYTDITSKAFASDGLVKTHFTSYNKPTAKDFPDIAYNNVKVMTFTKVIHNESICIAITLNYDKISTTYSIYDYKFVFLTNIKDPVHAGMDRVIH